jgi:aminodeoxyfutalosine deaminase
VTEIQEFIRRLPKAELHLHLEGTIAPATLVELSARHDTYPLTEHEAEALYKFTDFTEFIESFKAVTRRLRDPEDYELAAWRMMQQLAAQGVVHAEVFISVGVIYMWRNFDPRCFEPIFAGLERARERAAHELGLSLYWIFDAVRHFTVEEADRVFRKAAELRELYPSIVAIGLGGDERHAGSAPFRHSTPAPATPVFASPTTPAKPPAPRPSGKRSTSAPNASATPYPPFATTLYSKT